MDEFIKLLDGSLNYVSHEIVENTIFIHVVSNREKVICPYCGKPSTKAHSHYARSFQDLPMQGKKVQIILHTHPEAVQESDRFHLLKNLTDYCKDFLMKYLHTKITIEATLTENVNLEEKSLQLQNRLLTLEAKMEKAKELQQGGLNKHQICQQLSLGFYVFNKLMKMAEDEQVAYFKNSGQVKHEEKAIRKLMLINEVKNSHNLGHSMRKIAKEF